MPKTSLVELTPEQRLEQIAAILAKGVIRCQRRSMTRRPRRTSFLRIFAVRP